MRKLVFFIGVFLSGQLVAQEYKTILKPANVKFKEVEYDMWIPENVKSIKGIIFHQHGCGETAFISGRNAFYDLQWRALAKKWDFALMGSSYVSTTDCFDWVKPEEGSYQTFIQGISEIAGKSNHEELKNVSWILWGHSGGGHWAYKMVLQHPDKILCAVLKSPAWTDTSSVGLQVPMLCLLGMQESYDIYSSFVWAPAIETMKYRISKNASVCIAPDPTSGHESANSRLLAIAFIDKILSLRSNDRDLSINRSNQCYIDLDNFKLTNTLTETTYKKTGNWFPDKFFAEKWSEFVKTGTVIDKTPPLEPPYNVEVKSEVRSNIINWKAYADIESGIRGFRIYRNDKVINEDSIQLKWNFQLDYHDNPKIIYTDFEFIDRNINKRGKYKYQVSLVNQAGLESRKGEAIFINKD
jgi:pimeloyl-ACP methyl ester carboxylesterase